MGSAAQFKDDFNATRKKRTWRPLCLIRDAIGRFGHVALRHFERGRKQKSGGHIRWYRWEPRRWSVSGMVQRCAIKSCKSTLEGRNDIRFFRFPKSPERRRSWLERIEQAGGQIRWPTTAGDVLCSVHFTEGCFRKEPHKGLKNTAVPSEHLTSSGDNDNEEFFSCLVCRVEVKHVCELLTDAHIHRNVKKQMVCGHCRKPFDSYGGLMAHLTKMGFWKRFVPSKNPYAAVEVVRCTYQCSVCLASFDTLVARNEHQAEHVEEILASATKARRSGRRESNVSQSGKTESGHRRSPRSNKEVDGCPSDALGREDGRNQSRRTLPRRRRTEPFWKSHFIHDYARLTTRSGRKRVRSRKRSWLSRRPLRCSFCLENFEGLKLLARHCDLKHPNEEVPLELTCDVDQDYVPCPNWCPACRTRQSCIETLQELLDETDSDTETVTHDVAINTPSSSTLSSSSSKRSMDSNFTDGTQIKILRSLETAKVPQTSKTLTVRIIRQA